MKQYTNLARQKTIPLTIRLALMAAFVILILYSILLIREKLLRNADEMGTYLAESYAMEEENRIHVYSMLLNICTSYLEQTLSEGQPSDAPQKCLEEYSNTLEELMGSFIIDPYAVIDGKIVAADPWSGDSDYNYSSTEWYQKAVDADGSIIYTNSYSDAITGMPLITLARELEQDGNVLAFDILLDNFHTHKNKASMPSESSYFLFDGNNVLMYASTNLDSSSPEAADYLSDLVAHVRQGNGDHYSYSIKDLSGRRRSIYYYEMSNGWISVITIPIDRILQDGWDQTIVFLGAICIILLGISSYIMIHGYFSSKKMKHIADTLQLLGDSYYAIYRINYKKKTYETIKSSPDVKDQLGPSGEYKYFIEVLKTIVEDNIEKELETTFSTEHICSLIQDKIYDFGGDFKRKFPDGFKWVRIQIIYNEAMHLDEVIMCFRQVDAIKRREEQQMALLQNAVATAKKTVQQKTMFFSNASHDMRTPLNAIIGLSELAQKNKDNQELVSGYISKIQQSGKQLLNLVNDVLDMSRLEHDKGGSLNYAPMDLKQCIDSCAHLFAEQATAENKKLETDYRLEHSMVYCDFARLTQIMNNLISNGIKYSGSGACITVSLKELNLQFGHGKYQIAVSDTGIGMSKEFLDKIFEPFARETFFSSNQVTGTGLGMPIVKALVQQMSGEITIASQKGKGTTVTITLPLQLAEEDSEPEKETDRQELSSCSLDGKKILVAEDNEINMEIATECLSMLGADVIQAWNGQEAVEAFQASSPGQISAILLDMQMPVMDGCTAAKTIRALDRPDSPSVPIIAVTANVFAEDIAMTTEAGMNAHIPKPIDFDQLAGLLQEYTQRT